MFSYVYIAYDKNKKRKTKTRQQGLKNFSLSTQAQDYARSDWQTCLQAELNFFTSAKRER